MAQTNRQTALLGLLNQMSQNVAGNDQLGSAGIGIDLGIGLGGSKKPDKTNPPCTPPSAPTTFREVLLSLVNEQVQVTTPFGAVTGTLLSVQNDYIVMIDTLGDQVLIRIDKIELISEI